MGTTGMCPWDVTKGDVLADAGDAHVRPQPPVWAWREQTGPREPVLGHPRVTGRGVLAQQVKSRQCFLTKMNLNTSPLSKKKKKKQNQKVLPSESGRQNFCS